MSLQGAKMAKTTIEWTTRRLPDGTLVQGYSFNLVWGCVKVSEGCKFCYAESIATHFGFPVWGPNADRRVMSDAYWSAPRLWNRQAQAQGHQRFPSEFRMAV